jgi:hypothetical protein
MALDIFKGFKSNEVWKTQQDHWKTYQKNFITEVVFKIRTSGVRSKNVRTAAKTTGR